jgi:hypothetical protein
VIVTCVAHSGSQLVDAMGATFTGGLAHTSASGPLHATLAAMVNTTNTVSFKDTWRPYHRCARTPS